MFANFFRPIVVWLVIILAETAHGIIRNVYIAPMLGDLRSRQIGVFFGSLIIFGIACLFACWLRTSSVRSLLAIGAVWVVMTVIFEVSLGTALGLSADRITEDYDPTRGGLMIFGLVLMFLSPLLARKVRCCGDENRDG